MTEFDGRRFRDVMGHYPTGVALVTAVGSDGQPIGMIVGSFTSVSMDPPLVAYLPMINSYTFSLIREAEYFAINVLSAEQEGLCRRFASRIEDKWSGVEWTTTPGGAPVLEGAVAWIECTTESITEAGDHYLVMGRIQNMEVVNPVAPLLFFQGGYGKFAMSSLVARSDAPDLAQAIRMAEAAREEIEDLAVRLDAAVDLIAAVGEDLVYVGNASSADSTASSVTLGTRIPLMAPLGEQYVCWLGQEAIENWIARSGITDEEARESLLKRVEVAKSRGWSMSRVEPERELDYYDVLREYSEGDLTPARERALRAQIVQWSKAYDTVTIDANAEYLVHSLVVPVLDADEHPLASLRVADLPRPASGAQIMGWISELSICAQALTPKVSAVAKKKAAGCN